MTSLKTAMTSKLSLLETGIASTSTSVQSTVNIVRQETSTELKLISDDMHNRCDALERLVTTQHERTHDYSGSQHFTRISNTRLLGGPAILREACDIASVLPDSQPSAGLSVYQGRVSSLCSCPFRENRKSVAAGRVHFGRTNLSYQNHEISRHFPNCPFYTTKSESQTRVDAQVGIGVLSRLSLLVQASLLCTTGAGGLSISPHLSFRMTVKESPARKEISKIKWFIMEERRPISDTEMIKMLATAERKILRMFQAGEASPQDRSAIGENLLHAR